MPNTLILALFLHQICFSLIFGLQYLYYSTQLNLNPVTQVHQTLGIIHM